MAGISTFQSEPIIDDIYNFGADIIRTFYPMENDKPINLPTQTPAIYLFTSAPTRAAAAEGNGAAATISTWNESSVYPYPRKYTVSAIADPSPTGGTSDVQYWLAINFVTKTSGQTQTLIQSIWLRRTEGTATHPNVKAHDLATISPDIRKYHKDDAQLEEFVRAAEEHLRLQFLAKGYRWDRLKRLDQLKLPLIYKALSMAFLELYRRPDDPFDRRQREYEKRYQDAMAMITIPYDTDGDASADQGAQPVKNYIIASR